MTQYNMLNIKFSISQLNKLKPARKNRTEVTLNLSSNLIGNSNNETNFPHKNRGILLKGATRKITSQEGGFLDFFRPLMAAGLPLMKSVFTPLAKSVLLLLGLSAGMSAADAAIQKKIYGSGSTALIISNEEMEDIMEIVKSLEESGLLIQEISETIRKETKGQKGELLPVLLGALTASMLASVLTGKGVIRAGEGTIRTGENF